MQYKQMPPIQFIPVFEAAARHLSFKKAARELCVTAPAVGQQIKSFEDWLGKALFYRQTRLLSLTREGEYYFKVAQSIMAAHSKGYTEYARRFEKSALHISATLFVAQELLMPNYLKFSEVLPGRELRIEARMSNVDFNEEPIDAALRFGDGNWPELDCRLLGLATVTPVCSSSYARQHEFTGLSELYKHRLIYAEPSISDWGKNFWPASTKQAYDNIICDSYLTALKAASDGLGVALAILPTANAWINDGRLVLPFDKQIGIDLKYWLVSPKTDQEKPEIEALYTWLTTIFDALPVLDTPLETIELGLS